MKKLILLISFILIFGIANSQIVTDRPDMTESAVIVGKNAFQAEAGLSLTDYNYTSTINTKEFQSPHLLLRYGVTQKLELRLSSAYLNNMFQDNSLNYGGFGDIEIGAKYELVNDEATGFALGIISHLILPSGREEFSNNEVGLINRLAFSYDLSDKIGLSANIGYDRLEVRDPVFYSIAVSFAINEKIGIYVEPYSEDAFSLITNNNYNFGITYLVNNNFQLDASYGSNYGKVKPYDMNFISAGFSFRVGAN